ncbi:MAG: bifunctional diaminohydroxyphosphoribosylaminopyrimidine deaminase/5-amino-6-(5-phosphoribosylamino)uracil reductase RibD [Caldimicrobium thiodismutans]|jgi:diaminohydroxyphosphoribosylaminopyrimidine deaminase/5-amino-6-(5-phosphoribosylamino)uracil reductase
MSLKSDEFYMKIALKEAYKGLGKTSPNPPVGAVVVDPQTGEIISKGYHRAWGEPHAEREALSKAGDRARGAYLYVTLEPCSHYGKTPPCTEAILAFGIKRVVCGIKDPNPIACNGLKFLQEKGLEVKTGVLEREVKYLTRFFLSKILRKRPWIMVKIAQSIDGRIAVSSGDSKWISGQKALKLAHKLRSIADAILVGKNTILIDNPELTTRLVKGKNPIRIILDTKAELSPGLKVFEVSEEKRTILCCGEDVLEERLQPFRKKGVEIWKLPLKGGKIDLHSLMEKAISANILSILVEGGGKVNGTFLQANLIDEVFIMISPMIIGDPKGVFSFEVRPLKALSEAFSLYNCQVQKVGKDFLFHGFTSEGTTLLDTPLGEF